MVHLESDALMPIYIQNGKSVSDSPQTTVTEVCTTGFSSYITREQLCGFVVVSLHQTVMTMATGWRLKISTQKYNCIYDIVLLIISKADCADCLKGWTKWTARANTGCP